MHKLVLTAILLCVSAFAQFGGSGGPLLFSGVPTGACGTRQTAVNTTNGNFYACNNGAWLLVGPGAAGSAQWNTLIAPTGNQSIAMAAFTTTWTYNAATGLNANVFLVTDTTNNTGTGHLAQFRTASGSAMKPIELSSNGNGVEMSSVGVLAPIGTGHINADQCSGAACGTVTSVTGTAPIVSSGGATPAISATLHGATARLQTSDNTGTSGNVAKFAANGDVTDGGIAAANIAPLASPTFTGTVTLPVTGSIQCLHVSIAGVLSGTGSDCGAGGGGVSSVFTRTGAVVAAANDYTLDLIGNPAGAKTFALGNTNFLTFGDTTSTATSTSNLNTFTDAASNTGTGSVVAIKTGTSSAASPLTVTAQGTANGVQVSTAGVLAKIGTGSVNADKVNSVAYPASPSTNTVPVVTGANTITYQIVGLTSGGSGATTQQGALNNIMPTPTRAGDVVYYNGANWVALAGNNLGTNFLQENASGVPSWAAGSSTVSWSSILDPSGNLALNMGANTSTFNTTTAASNYFKWANTTAATSGTAQSSPILSLCGQGWESATPANTTDCWTFQNVIANGSNPSPTLTFANTGSSTAPAIVKAPEFDTSGTSQGLFALTASVTAPTSFPANSFGWLAPNSATITTPWFFQPLTATGPAATGPMEVGAVASNVSAISYGTKSGNTSKYVTSTGTLTSGDVADWDVNGNAIDAGFLASNVVRKDTTNTGAAAMTLDMNASTSAAALRVPNIAGASSTTAGVLSYDTTNKNLHVGANTVDNIAGLIPSTITPANNDCVKWTVATGVVTLNTAGAACGSGGGSGTPGSAIFSTTTLTGPSNTATETTILSTSGILGSKTIAANSFSNGALLQTVMTGFYSTPAASADNLTLRIKCGATVLGSSTVSGLTINQTNQAMRLNLSITAIGTGASGALLLNTIAEFSTSSLAGTEAKIVNTSAVAFDFTTSCAFDVTAQWGAAQVGESISMVGAAYIPGSSGVADPGSNGIMVRTALNTSTARTLTAGSASISVTNGDGTAGNPTVDVGTAVLTDANTKTLTNKTADAEGTGNVFSRPFYISFTPSCNNATSSPGAFNVPTSAAATFTCFGTTTTQAASDFVDASTTTTIAGPFTLPQGWTGNIDVRLVWFANAASANAVRWSVALGCVADSAAINTGPTYNTATASNTAYTGTANQRKTTTLSALTTTGCAAGNSIYFQVQRIGADAGDTLTATAELLEFQVEGRATK